MLIRFFQWCDARLSAAWRVNSTTPAAWLRLGIAVATFLAICVGSSPEELRRAQSNARDIENPKPARNVAEEFYTISVGESGAALTEVDGNSVEADARPYPEFLRIAIIRSSESDQFRDPVHIYEFAAVSDAIIEDLKEVAWL